MFSGCRERIKEMYNYLNIRILNKGIIHPKHTFLKLFYGFYAYLAGKPESPGET